jgi:uncharacterized membrane protein YuzA (DUF378 family)
MRTSTIGTIAAALAAVGAVNWGLVALAEFDLVAEVFGLDFGQTNTATRIVYAIVGIAGLVLAATLISPKTIARDNPNRPVSRAR